MSVSQGSPGLGKVQSFLKKRTHAQYAVREKGIKGREMKYEDPVHAVYWVRYGTSQ
jgi:hypothetical protein